LGGLLYYIPGASGSLDRDAAEAAGIGHAFAGTSISSRECGGPDGGRGQVVGVDGSLVGYFPDRQTWTLAAWLGDGVWIGVDGDVEPESLERDEIVPGHLVTLADGRQWRIPVARMVSEVGAFVALPTRRSLDESGKWVAGEVVERYSRLWDYASRYWDAVFGSAQEVADSDGEERVSLTFDFDGQTDAAVEALSANYRIGKGEASALEILDDGSVSAILNALVDIPSLVELKKKRASDDSGSSGGRAGDGTNTSRLSPTSSR